MLKENFINLILKKAKAVSDYTPIRSTSDYKIIAERLKGIFPRIILENYNAFTKGTNC